MVGASQDASRTPAVPEGAPAGVFAGVFVFEDVDVADADAPAEPSSERDESPPPSGSHPLAKRRAPSAKPRISRRRTITNRRLHMAHQASRRSGRRYVVWNREMNGAHELALIDV